MPLTTNGNDNFRIYHYNDQDGMSQWHVTKILQDRLGMIWMSTWNGLNRYDGYNFVAFKCNPGDGNIITSDRVRNIILDYDLPALKNKAVGNIYCRIEDDVFVFDIRSYKYKPVDDKTQRYVLKEMERRNNEFGGKTMTYGTTNIDRVTRDFKDMQSNHWLVTADGVYKVTSVVPRWNYVQGVSKNVVRVLYRDQQGYIWICTREDKCVAVFRPDLTLLGYLGRDGNIHSQPVEFSPVYCIYGDKSGTVWLGTKPDGIFRAKPRNNSAGPQGGYNMENLNFLIPKSISENPDGTYIYDIASDCQGNLWIGSHGDGLFCVTNPEAERLSDLKLLTFNNSSNYPSQAKKIRRISFYDDNTALVTTTSGLLVVTLNKKTNKDNSVIARMKGWGSVDFNLHTREADRANSLSNNALMDVLRDSEGNIIVTTESGGVNILETKDIHAKVFDFKHYGVAEGLGSDIALASLELSKHNILIQCNNQVTCIDPAKGIISNYSPAFWSQRIRFSDARPILLKDGRLLLSTETGAITINRSEFSKQGFIPKIVLSSLKVSDEPTEYNINHLDTITLSSSQRSLQLTYAALDYTDNSCINYITKLGEQGSWSEPTTNHELNLQDIKPGTYKLYIRSSNAQGQWCENERVVTIIVEPKVLESWWGQLLIWLLFAGLIALGTYVYSRMRSIDQKRRETLAAYLSMMEEKERILAEREKERQARHNQVTLQADMASETADEPEVTISATEGVSIVSVDEPQQQEVKVIAPMLSADDEAFMRRLTSFIEENMQDSNIGVADIAQATATSRSGLNRRMHQLLGVTPADFLREARMKRACQMLKTSGQSTSDIAYACGFSDPKYFSRCFKQSIGMTPKEYRTV